jgi:hypothetical protein
MVRCEIWCAHSARKVIRTVYPLVRLRNNPHGVERGYAIPQWSHKLPCLSWLSAGHHDRRLDRVLFCHPSTKTEDASETGEISL